MDSLYSLKFKIGSRGYGVSLDVGEDSSYNVIFDNGTQDCRLLKVLQDSDLSNINLHLITDDADKMDTKALKAIEDGCKVVKLHSAKDENSLRDILSSLIEELYATVNGEESKQGITIFCFVNCERYLRMVCTSELSKFFSEVIKYQKVAGFSCIIHSEADGGVSKLLFRLSEKVPCVDVVIGSGRINFDLDDNYCLFVSGKAGDLVGR